MEEEKTIGELSGQRIGCYGCGKELSDKKPEEVFIDPFFWDLFAGVFCSIECRDWYVDSK